MKFRVQGERFRACIRVQGLGFRVSVQRFALLLESFTLKGSGARAEILKCF